MSKPKPVAYLAFLALITLALGGVSALKGGFYIAKHEGDTLHLLQIVFRMADGEWPHLDFMTPIGAMAFLPIAAFVKSGLGIGNAILWSQILVAAVMLPAIFWAGFSRFNKLLAYLFGLTVLVLILALVHGEANRLVSISMHYNRWAWAAAYVAILLAVLPPVNARNDLADGVIIGVAMAFLVLCKVTYFVAFAPPIVLVLLLRGAGRVLILSLLSGLIVAAIYTVFSGVEYWFAYLDDLRTVSGSQVRPQPGAPLQIVIGSPQYLGGSLALLIGVILLRQANERILGLALLLLVPGFFYVTFQNFGNDPQWLMLLAILLLVPQINEGTTNSFGWDMTLALRLTAMAALAFAAPSFLNLAYSPFRHMAMDESKYTPMLANLSAHSDLQTRTLRTNRVDGTIGLDGEGSGLEDRRELADRESSRTEFQGELLPDCELRLGLGAWFETIVADLEANGHSGKYLFAADIFTSHWLFGDIKRLPNGSPWFYGGRPGFEAAELMIVPLCPASEAIRKQILDDLGEDGLSFEEVHRTPLYILFKVPQTG